MDLLFLEVNTEYLACAKYGIDPDDKDVKTPDGDVSTEALDGENPAVEATVIHFDRKAFLENFTRRELSAEVGTVFSDIKIEWEIILQILKSEIE